MLTYLERDYAAGFANVTTVQIGITAGSSTEGITSDTFSSQTTYSASSVQTVSTDTSGGTQTFVVGGNGTILQTIDNAGATTYLNEAFTGVGVTNPTNTTDLPTYSATSSAVSGSTVDPVVGATTVEGTTSAWITYGGVPAIVESTSSTSATGQIYTTTGTTKTESASTSGMTNGATTAPITVTATTGTTAVSIFTDTFTYNTQATDSDNTVSSSSLGTTTTEISFGQADSIYYVYNTVFVDDSTADAWVLLSTAAEPGVFTDLFSKITEATTLYFTDFASTRSFALMEIPGAPYSTGMSSTDGYTSSWTFPTTTGNSAPLPGARQAFIGTGAAPIDGRTSVTTTDSSSTSYDGVTGTIPVWFSSYSQGTTTTSSFTTSVLTTTVDSDAGHPVFADGAAQEFTVTTTAQTTFVAPCSTSVSLPWPLWNETAAGESISGGMTSVVVNCPQAQSWRAELLPPARFAALAPPGFAQNGATTSGGMIYRDVSAEFLSFNSTNLMPSSVFEALSFNAWGGLGEQTDLSRMAAGTGPFPLSFYSSTTTTTGTEEGDTATTRLFFTVGSAQVLSTEDDAFTIGLTVPHTVSKTGTPSSYSTSAFATAAVRFGLGIEQAGFEPWRMDPLPDIYVYGGTPADPVPGGRADLLQYWGAELDRTSNSSAGAGSATGETGFTDQTTASAPADALVHERSDAIWDVLEWGGTVQMVTLPRYRAFVETPAF